jgi:probable phosphoglycerate mutase
VDLDDAGWEAARRLGERLRDVRLRAVYASPIERTWQTAQALADVHGLEPVALEGLLEVDYGRWQGRTLASLARLQAWRRLLTSPSTFVFPEGESLNQAQHRAVQACMDVVRAHRRRTVALVTHADIVRLVLSHFLGQPLDLYHRLTIAPASVSVVDLDLDGPPRVVTINGSGAEPWR